MHSTILPTHPRTGLQAIGRRRNGEPIWPVMGGAPDPDPENDPDEDGQPDEPGGDADGSDDDADDAPDDSGLGDKGKKALDAMKAKVKEERQKRRDTEAELEKLRKAAEKKPDDDQPSEDEIRREAEQAAAQKANARIVRSEIRAAAAGKLADPKDALVHLDLDQFEVDDNGEVDSDEVAEAIDDLIKSKPYLAAQSGKRFQGTADGGAARNAGKPKQLTREDLDGMSPAEIVKAKADGRLKDVLGIK